MLLRGGACLALAVLVFIQVGQVLPVYVLWLAIAVAYVSYRGRFALMPALHQPEKYGTVANVLYVMDLAAHVAVAVFCRVGWFGFVLLVLTWFCFGRFAWYLAIRRAAKDILRILVEREPDMTAEERARLAHTMLEQRQRVFHQGRPIS
jgi:hypothetical protein